MLKYIGLRAVSTVVMRRIRTRLPKRGPVGKWYTAVFA